MNVSVGLKPFNKCECGLKTFEECEMERGMGRRGNGVEWMLCKTFAEILMEDNFGKY